MDFEIIKEKLKQEFIGIDSQIDSIIDMVKPWYNNPELYDSPCIINLWGLTGHGKTSLVNRMIELLGEGHNRLYMNCHSMIGEDAYFMETFVEDNTTNKRTNKFIIFDDFQYVRTIDEEGAEKTSSVLSVMWNLMDNGIIHESFTQRNFKEVNKCLEVLRKVESDDDIVEGKFKNLKKYLPEKYIANPVSSVFNMDSILKKKNTQSTTLKFFIEDDTTSSIAYLGRSVGFDDCEDSLEFIQSRIHWGAFRWRNFFMDLLDAMKRGKNQDFHNSIIFVIGNIDEAYYGAAKEVNPEMSADQLHEITSRVNIVDIKKGLQKRFRNEQIARLGNTHIIYQSFTCKDYRNIINKCLDTYSTRFMNVIGLNLIFDDTMKKCIYDEGVFPAQGVRPLLSTINDIVKTNVPKAIDILRSRGVNNLTHVECRFDISLKSVIINAFDVNMAFIDKVEIPVFLRVKDSYKDNTETIANTSVHESGHFIIYKYLTGNSPVKVISKSLEQSCLGYMMEKFDEGVPSRERMTQEICVCLAGYVAESLVFDSKYQSTGASSDIENATSVLVSMLHEWGFGVRGPICISQMNNPDNENALYLTESDRIQTNDFIIRSMGQYERFVRDLLANNPVLHECFKKSFTLLNTQGELTENDIKEISDIIETAPGYDPISTHYYSDALASYE